jgi:transposase
LSQRKKQIAERKAEASSEQILLLGDSAEVSLFPTITRCWTRIGQQRVILTPGVRAAKRWNWGAVNPVTGQTVSVIHHRRNNVGFRRLLATISRAYDLPAHPERKVILFVDNDMAHKAKAVRRLLEKHENRIQLEWLPSYSPELNAQEDVWQHMRRRVTHNHYFEHMDALLEAVEQFHHQLESEPEQVLRLLKKWAKLIST